MHLFKSEKSTATATTPILLNPPLVEAIFEIRWELEADKQTGRMRDPSYPMLYGRLYERIKKEFPIVEDLPSVQAHPEAAPFVPRHRMRKDKAGYPLVQVGPGILTVNDAKGYSWTGFKALALRMIESVVDLYPEGVFPLNLIKSELRYINGILLDDASENPLAFLAEKLHTKIELDSELHKQNSMNENPNALGFNIGYPLQKPVGNLGLSLNLGQFDNKPAYLLQTVVQSIGDHVPAMTNDFSHWLKEGHDVAENCFRIFCKGPLMKKFCGS